MTIDEFLEVTKMLGVVAKLTHVKTSGDFHRSAQEVDMGWQNRVFTFEVEFKRETSE